MKPILVACGVLREARIAAGAGVVAVAGGGNSAGLEARLQACAPGAAAMLSFGLCGALDPALRIGDWVVDGDDAWCDALCARLPGAVRGRVFATDALAGTHAARAARAATGAAATDMESHVAARVAARHGLIFAVARVVSDTAHDVLPPAFSVAMRPDGGTDIAAILASLARHPAQLPGFVRAAKRALRALGELQHGRALLGPRLAFPDLGERAADMV